MSFGFGASGGAFGSTGGGGFGSTGGGGGGGLFGSTGASTFGSFGSPQQPQQQQQQAGVFGSPAQAQVNSGVGAFGAATPGSQPFGVLKNPNNDYEVPRDANAAKDSISALAWSPVQGSNLLANASWDNKVRLYDVAVQGAQTQAVFKGMVDMEAPVLDVCYKHDGMAVFAAGCSNLVKMWDLNAPQSPPQTVGKHDAPIQAVRWISNLNLLCTGSWDKTLQYWDLRSPTPALKVTLPGRVDCMDIKGQYCVVGTGGSEAERQVCIFNLNNPRQPERVLNANSGTPDQLKPLRHQYRALSVFPDASGFAIASIEGRCSIQYINPQQAAESNFAFKCHRHKEKRLIFAVNSIAFHHLHDTFCTAGADGMWNFWDKDARQRLHQGQQVLVESTNQEAPVTATGFNSTGNLFAYSVSYDWSKGVSGQPRENISTMFIHHTPATEIQKKPKANANSTRRF